jgi:hypothetical protein
LQNTGSAAVPDSVVSSTIRATSLFAAGHMAATGPVSAKVAALTEGVLKAMMMSKLKAVVAVVLVLGFIVTGATVLSCTAVAQSDKPAALATLAPREGKADPAKDDETLKHTLLTLEKARFDSCVRQDADGLGKILTEEWVGFSMNHRYTKADYLESLKRQRVGPDYKIHDVELIRLNEKAAILSYKAEWKVLSTDGDLLAKRNRRACVSWVQRGGGWVVAAVQDMVIGEE